MQGAALHPLKELFEKSSLRILKNFTRKVGGQKGNDFSLARTIALASSWGPSHSLHRGKYAFSKLGAASPRLRNFLKKVLGSL